MTWWQMHSLSTSIVAPVRNSSSLKLIRCAQIKQSKMFLFTELCKPLGHEGETDWERVHNYNWDFTCKIAIWALHHLQRKQCIRINQLKVTVLLPVAQYVTNTVSISVYIVCVHTCKPWTHTCKHTVTTLHSAYEWSLEEHTDEIKAQASLWEKGGEHSHGLALIDH